MNARRGIGTSAVVLAVLAAVGAMSAAAAPSSEAPAPITGAATSYTLSEPVRDLEPAPSGAATKAPPRVNPLADEPGAGRRRTWNRPETPADPLAGDSAGGRTPAPGLVFDGTANPAGCGGCTPPDTTGDVGPNHYVQLVNATKVAIFNKSGVIQTPIFNLGSLWPIATTCRSNAGDPQVLYDPLADRWLMAQFNGASTLCFAVSQTADPLGSYHLFTFNVSEFPDYFKVGVFPDGYYVSANETTSDYTAYAFNRTKMLAGDLTANFVKFAGQTNFLLPADIDGTTQPAAAGGLFYTFKDDSFHGGSDRIELFRLTPDFTTPASSTFAHINTFPIASYTYTVCGFFNFNCIPQEGTAQKVDALSEWPMQRFAFRSFPGDHEALVGNFVVKSHTATATTAGAGIRWFELRNTGAGWSLFQEGTLDPNDGIDRFMGSVAIDRMGNIGLGYSASSGNLNPSVRYVTRAPGDPAGTFQAEQTLKAGGGSQTGSNRWGDYSAMSVDPANECDFWYTNEYYSTNSASAWKTAIGSFTAPGCATPVVPPVVPQPVVTPPSNTFTLDKLTRNKKKGTATLTVSVPGPGVLALSGAGVKPQRPVARSQRRANQKAVAAAGTVNLVIKATGVKERKLLRRGKVKVRVTVTFTPTGGSPASQQKKVKLTRRLRR